MCDQGTKMENLLTGANPPINLLGMITQKFLQVTYAAGKFNKLKQSSIAEC